MDDACVLLRTRVLFLSRPCIMLAEKSAIQTKIFILIEHAPIKGITKDPITESKYNLVQ